MSYKSDGKNGKNGAICILILINLLYLSSPVFLITTGIMDHHLSSWAFLTASVMVFYFSIYWFECYDDAKWEKKYAGSASDILEYEYRRRRWRLEILMKMVRIVFLFLISYPALKIYREQVQTMELAEKQKDYNYLVLVFCILHFSYFFLEVGHHGYMRWQNTIQLMNGWAFKNVKILV
ncbi:hypothetical protein B9Z55_020864 [Caenorhabditis nigoni]|uniref:Uncharacterized protein n=1 Tax=Caenorhabditis nigoni TaxID=1611254 RepID=A0A2G5TPH1_9PELO|nr:hypothetical protein B9Z55_020864 [Caenorhabditis nigoni]